MKKRIRIRGVILGIVLALFLWLIYTIITIAPVYPAFQKQVETYEELRKALEAVPEVCFPDSSMLELTDTSYYNTPVWQRSRRATGRINRRCGPEGFRRVATAVRA